MLFQHAGYRSLWPVIAFLPWLAVGIAYLVMAMFHRHREVRATAVPALRVSRSAAQGSIASPIASDESVDRQTSGAQLIRNARCRKHGSAIRAMATEYSG